MGHPIHFMFVSMDFQGQRIEWRYIRFDQVQYVVQENGAGLISEKR